ncbi:hypothetical protein AVDCRST_MAG84-5251 [uncultured Microcoleus sp.]|uniref:Uncharacterized protein n=1 Tax=uncultured Microcoleus sp. TaxID=259945 RepID=A0A6J4NBT6_9CYAN|nr:hypothetical protein AVDCRST_MAG84-5251 [uncultured Microcoleus sp.]
MSGVVRSDSPVASGLCLGMQEAREGERLSPVALWTIAHGWQLPRLKEVVAVVLMRKCLN